MGVHRVVKEEPFARFKRDRVHMLWFAMKRAARFLLLKVRQAVQCIFIHSRGLWVIPLVDRDQQRVIYVQMKVL